MGYDAYITRAEDWSSLDEGEWITPEEWLAVVDEDPEMDLICDSGPYVAAWLGDPSYTGTILSWEDGIIQIKNPTKEAILKMEDLARRSCATVQGDDGELYKNGEPT